MLNEHSHDWTSKIPHSRTHKEFLKRLRGVISSERARYWVPELH